MYIFQSSLCQTAHLATSDSALRQTVLSDLFITFTHSDGSARALSPLRSSLVALVPPLLLSVPRTWAVLPNAVVCSTNFPGAGFGFLTCPQVGNLLVIKSNIIWGWKLFNMFKTISLLEFKSIKLFTCNTYNLLGHCKSKIKDTIGLAKELYCYTCKHDLRGQTLISNPWKLVNLFLSCCGYI